MRPIWGAMGLAIVALTLVACQPPHAEWQTQCTASHVDPFPIPVTTIDSQGNPSTTIQFQYNTVCDETARICVPGRDGSTRCDPEQTPATDATGVL